MCHATLQDPKLYSLLLLIDEDLAAQAQSAGCSCGGALHSARYPRKPRGAPRELLEQYRSRLSFCCAACRRRTTPESVRYLGRRVYLAVVPENLSRTNEQHGRRHQITLQVARNGDAGRRVPEMRLPYPGSVDAPSADLVRPLLKIGACASRGNSQDIGQ